MLHLLQFRPKLDVSAVCVIQNLNLLLQLEASEQLKLLRYS